MHTEHHVVNVVIAGLGGQGVITASDILADAAFRAGYEIKKSEIHGMSQRGGSVSSDVRFGPRVLSPMVPTGEADYLVVLSDDQVEPNRHQLKPGGVLITPAMIDDNALQNRKALNVALLGALSAVMPDITESTWLDALLSALPEKLHEVNRQAWSVGRAAARKI